MSNAITSKETIGTVPGLNVPLVLIGLRTIAPSVKACFSRSIFSCCPKQSIDNVPVYVRLSIVVMGRKEKRPPD